MSLSENEIISRIRMEYGETPFTVYAAMGLFTFNELPESVRERLARLQTPRVAGHTSRAFSRVLRGLGCVPVAVRRHRQGGRYWVLPPLALAGRCRRCQRQSGNVTYHEQTCGVDEVRIGRAGAHAVPERVLGKNQRFRRGVTDLGVARVLELMDRKILFYRLPSGPWKTRDPRITLNVSLIVQEMLRTGLARQWRDEDGDHLVPAPVHLRSDGQMTACKVIGEDLGWMRVRLVDDRKLADCPACLAVARKSVRAV